MVQTIAAIISHSTILLWGLKMTYLNQQLEKLALTNGENYLSLRITSTAGATNWLTLTNEQLEQIFNILKQGEE